ncbi:MAG: hypothetical protein JWQ71_3067 [Pedosphaera sp.]|nr:hypothetical protein [Pedosphaera sp.]
MKPELYLARAKVKVDMRYSDYPGMETNASSPAYDPYFIIHTEFKIIQSEIILDKVITNLNLTELWTNKSIKGPSNTAAIREILRHSLELRPIRGTSLIAIKVTWSDPKQAADIANAIAGAYSDHQSNRRTAFRKSLHERLLLELKELDSKIKSNQTPADLEKLQQTRDALAAKIDTEFNPLIIRHAPVLVVETAEPASQPIFPTHIIGINLAIIGSVMSFFGLFSLRQAARFSANQPSNP